MNVPGGRLNLCKGLVARAHLTIPALLHWEEYIGQWSREQVAVPTVLPKGAAARSTHPTRREASLADGRPSVGVAVVWRTQAHPPPAAGQSGPRQRRGQHLSLLARPRFSPPKRLQLPTVMGIKLRGPEGGLRRSVEGRAGRERELRGNGAGDRGRRRLASVNEQEWGPLKDGRPGSWENREEWAGRRTRERWGGVQGCTAAAGGGGCL